MRINKEKCKAMHQDGIILGSSSAEESLGDSELLRSHPGAGSSEGHQHL